MYNKLTFSTCENTLSNFRVPAIEMYTGQQHIRLTEGIASFQASHPNSQIDLWVLSAGYGLISGTQPIVPYECTFQEMRNKEIVNWSTFLRIPQSAKEIFCQSFDLLIIALGEKYLRSLQLDVDTVFASPTLFISKQSGSKFIQGKGQMNTIPLSLLDTTRFSCGMVGLKGEIAKRILKFVAEGNPISSLFVSGNEVLAFLK